MLCLTKLFYTEKQRYLCPTNFKIQGMISSNEDVVRHLCFGVDLHPCHTPRDMTVYIEVWEKSAYNASFVKNVDEDSQYIIPGEYYGSTLWQNNRNFLSLSNFESVQHSVNR